MGYLVRQYKPNFFTGFQCDVVSVSKYEDITEVPWASLFKSEDFVRFSVEPYGKELIVSAHYKDGKHYVVGFALDENSTAEANEGGLLKDNWRYKPHLS